MDGLGNGKRRNKMKALFAALIKAILEFSWTKITKPKTAEEGEGINQKENKLRDQIIKDTKGNTRLPLVFFIVLFLFTSGCFGTRTVYVPYGKSVQLRKTIPSASIWAFDKNGKRVSGKIDLHEGWYALPMPDLESDPDEEK